MNKKDKLLPKYTPGTCINHPKHGKCTVVKDTGQYIKIVDEKGNKHTYERYS